jgi:hypothetical protein
MSRAPSPLAGVILGELREAAERGERRSYFWHLLVERSERDVDAAVGELARLGLIAAGPPNRHGEVPVRLTGREDPVE